MICQHQFIKVDELSKPDPSRPASISLSAGFRGAKVVCALCAEVRAVWETGELYTIIAGSLEIKHSDNVPRDPNSTATNG